MEDDAKREILEAIHAFAEQVDQRFGRLEAEVSSVKSQMATKDYIDRRIGELRGDLVLMTRKEDVKLSALVEELVSEGSLQRYTADRILAMEPFAQA